MSFNNRIVKSYAQGALVAFTAPLASYKGSQIALTGVTSGSTASTAGLVISMAQNDIEWDSLAAIVETDITTSTITVATKWQVSNDGTNWIDVRDINGTTRTTVAAAGSGSLVTTQYIQYFNGINNPFPYVRLAALVGVTTGGAGDNVTVSYNFRKRWNQ